MTLIVVNRVPLSRFQTVHLFVRGGRRRTTPELPQRHDDHGAS
jgi:hypothetical protein